MDIINYNAEQRESLLKCKFCKRELGSSEGIFAYHCTIDMQFNPGDGEKLVLDSAICCSKNCLIIYLSSEQVFAKKEIPAK